MSFTNEQILTLASDRHLSVTANAGSGKTTALVNKYVSLLLKDKDRNPYNILAITFTRKAAAEMKARAIGEIEKKLQDAKNADDSVASISELYDLRLRLSNAQISTIHSFCSSLLRDYPIEAGLSPNFIELSEADKKRIKDSVIRKTMEYFLEKNEEDINEVFEKLGLNKIKEILENLYSKKEDFENLKEFYNKDSEELKSEIIKDYLDYFTNQYIYPALEVVINRTYLDGENQKSAAKIEDKVAEYKLRAAKYIELKNELDKKNIVAESEFKDLIEYAVQLRTIKIGNKILLNVFCCDYKKEDYAHIKDYDFQGETTLFNYSKILFKVFEKALELEKEEKSKASGIDFDDMILIVADKLLNNEFILKELRERYKHILVDEFQDTNHPQFKIINKLVSAFSDDEQICDNKLFIVGDVKQSIYGFRGADVRVFNSAKEIIKKANSKLKDLPDRIETENGTGFFKNSDEKNGDIKLLESFRMLPNPAAFINYFGTNLFKEKKSDYDSDYEELIIGRNTVDLENYINSSPKDRQIKLPEDKFGSVHFLACINRNNGSSASPADNDYDVEKKEGQENEKEIEKNDLSEALMIASYIKKQVAKDKIFNYGDIAVLSRSVTKFKPLVAAFQDMGVPYIISSGKGFYQTQETMDVIAFLKFLYNSEDDISLAEILLSSFFCLDETDLFEISTNGKGDFFWEKFNDFVSQLPEEKNEYQKRISYACKAISSLKEYAQRISIATLINQILDIGGWYGAAAGTPARAQMDKNIQKIIDIAISFEARGFKNLHDFVEELDILQENSSEPEAAQITTENAVQILTIHAAKGLEWDCVYIYNLNKAMHPGNDVTITSKYGLTFKLPQKDFFKKEQTTLLHNLNKNFRSAMEESEEKRLFYVAMTRAKQCLVMSGNFVEKIDKSGKSSLRINEYFKIFETGYGKQFSDILLKQTNNFTDTNEYELKWNNLNSEESKQKGVQKAKIAFDIHFVSELDVSSDIQQYHPEINVRNPLFLTEVIESEISGINVSASRYMSYKNDPMKFLLTYKYGLKTALEEMIIHDLKSSEMQEKKGGIKEGIYTHGLLCRFESWINLKDKSPKLEQIWQEITVNEDPADYEGLKEKVFSTCETLAKLPFFELLPEYQIFTELELLMPFYDDYLIGAMDLVLVSEDSVDVIDWKTNNVRNKTEMLETAEKYKPQMEIYIALAAKKFPGKSRYSTRLIFTKLTDASKESGDWSVYMEKKNDEIDSFFLNLYESITEMKALLI